MKSLRFYGKLTAITLGKLCQRRVLLAGLTLLCLLLPVVIGPAAETALSNGVSFSGITLAVSGPEGDPVPEMLEQVMSNMKDISQYCEFRAMDYDDAAQALEQGEVTAILKLPEDFVQGILNGQNPDVELIVPEDRPLEALLTLWVGQSASDLLASFQNGIYAVLELYREVQPDGMTYNDTMTAINMRYINWTMNRQDMFRTRTVSAAQLPISLHYGLSLMAYLLLAVAPLFVVVYQKDWLSAQRRLRCAGRGALAGFLCTYFACTIILLPLVVIPQLFFFRGAILQTLGTALLSAAFCAAFGSLCCLVTSDIGSCGALSFSCAVVFLAVSGGIVPPVMLPATLRGLMDLSPITWLRNAAVLPMGDYDVDDGTILWLAAAAAAMIFLSALLYLRRSRRQEGML